MRRVGRSVFIACAIALAACGGDGGTSASELEATLTEPSPFEDPDPVIEADCPEDLADGEDAEVICTTTTESGAKFEVTVQNSGDDGITYNSVPVDGDVAKERTGNPKDVARLERWILEDHELVASPDRTRRATDVECPDDFVEEEGVRTTCMMSLADGSVVNYDVRVTAKEVHYNLNPIPEDILAHYIVGNWNRTDPESRAESVDCPEPLPTAKGSTTTCTLTTTDGATRDAEVTARNATGGVAVKYGE